jgi:DNA-binding PadR family transcriptional regulator
MGHETRSDNFQASFSTANGRLKSKGFIKKGDARGYYVITAKGKSACAKLVAQMDAAQMDAAQMEVAQMEEGEATGKTDTITTEDLILVAIQNANGKLLGSAVGQAVIEAGYKAGDNADADLKAALGRLKDTGLIRFTKDDQQRTQFETTTAGNKRLAAMA